MCPRKTLTNVVLTKARIYKALIKAPLINQPAPGFPYFKTCRRQQGFLLPAAAFILVGLGALAVAVSRLSGQSSLSAVQEVVSVQTFYAAESGAQYAMSRIFYVPSGGIAISRAAADSNCADLSGASLNFGGDGLANCSTSLTCSISNDSANLTSFYHISSAASCGIAEVTAQRSIEVAASMQ